MITLAHPWLLWLLTVLPLAAALRWWWSGRARRAHASLGSTVAALRRRSPGRELVRAGLLWSGLACGILALAGPRWGEAEQVRQASGADLLIALDCSRSMLATDLFPDRLRLARRKALDLLRLAPELRVALLPFAGTAALRCPLTGDHLAVAALLDDCDPELFPADAGLQGTAIGGAVRSGLDVLAREAGAGQAILVISDGADPEEKEVAAAASAAKQRGVPVYGLFVGDPERSVTVQIDGRPVTMTSERQTLDQLATATGAITVNVTVDDADVTALANHFSDHLARRPWAERSRVVASERYAWPLGLAVVLLTLGWLLPTARAAALALLAGLTLGWAPGLAAGEPWRELAPIISQAKDDPVGARAALEQLLLRHPDSPATHYNLGCLLLDSDPTGAARHFEIATASGQLELAADAWHNLALARLQLGRLEEALAAAEQALRRRPEVADFLRTRDELRRALLARSDALRRAAEEEAKRLRLATTELPPAHLGEPYSVALSASGGTAPYRYSAASLPDGLHLGADGTLQGTPSKAGSTRLAITVADGAKATANGALTLEVLPAPAITTTVLPEAIVETAYRTEVQCEGLIAPRWTISGLPSGLTADGPLISGTPTVQGTSTVQVVAQDATHRATRSLELVVGDSFAPAESRLPPATAFAAYRHRLTVRGRAKSFSWIHAAAEHGLSIAADGSVSGTPDQAGELTLHATIAAEDGRQRAVELILPVNPPPVIEEDKTIELTRGKAVNRPLKVSGGTPPYRWSGNGAPPGVRVDSDGVLRGAPSQVGESTLLITCEDHWQAGTELQVTINVVEPKPQDQDEKDQQEQKDHEQASKDQQDQQDAEQQKKEDQQGKEEQAKADQAQQGPEKKDKSAGQTPAKEEPAQPPTAAEQAADRWLETLPKDDRAGLRQQLLDGAPAPARRGDKPW